MVVKLQDDIKVHPSDLGKPRAQAISAVLEKLYLDKVIADVVRGWRRMAAADSLCCRTARAAATCRRCYTFLRGPLAFQGLVITLYDILSIGDGQIYHSEGSATFQVPARCPLSSEGTAIPRQAPLARPTVSCCPSRRRWSSVWWSSGPQKAKSSRAR